ncbi:MAG: metallophosphoesterase [Polyangiaceae bacterium]|nr:metallophosphoesterase [Polyangiaceae bacterium]
MVNHADPFRLAVFGDTRSNHDDHAAVIRAMVPENAAAVFHTGDLVSNGSSASDWDMFFQVERPLLLRAPLYPAVGNHEGEGDIYRDIFELPPDTPEAERYYAVRFATALFINLDLYASDFEPQSQQHAWLQQVLSQAANDTNIRQRFVGLHHGPYDSGTHGSNMSVRNGLVPLFEQYGVDIVFSGHDHCYERGTVNGVKYVVTGGGGAPLYPVSGSWWTEARASELHYVLLDIHGAKTTYTAKRPDGSVLDSFVLGEDVSECASAQDCTSQTQGSCEPDEDGAWACAQRACLWNCVKTPEVAPDGGPAADGSVQGDGSVHTDAAANADVGGSGADASEPPQHGAIAPSDDGGCGCRLAGAGADRRVAGLLALGAALIAAATTRRRRRG